MQLPPQRAAEVSHAMATCAAADIHTRFVDHFWSNRAESNGVCPERPLAGFCGALRLVSIATIASID